AQPTQQMAQDRGGRALALGPRDAHHALSVGFLQPEPEPSDDGEPVCFQLLDRRAVPALAGGLHDELAPGERTHTTGVRGHHRKALYYRRRRTIIHEDRTDAQPQKLAHVRAPFHADAPDANAPPPKVRPGGRRPHTSPERSAVSWVGRT